MRTALVPEPGPQRVYALATLVNTFGFGLVVTSLVLYFTRVVHLGSLQVGLGLTISGLIGLVAGVPVGALADRHGPRTVVRVTFLLQFLTALGYLFIRDFAAFVVIATVDMLAMNANQAADGALLRRVGGDDAAVFRSATHAISNVGISLGAVGCAIAVQIGTADAYRALIAVNALTFLGAWLVSARLPKYEPLPVPDDGPRWGPLADRAFVGYAAHNALLSMQYMILLLPLPLWIVGHTRAPGWSVGALLLLNTFIVIAFQVRVGRNVQHAPAGRRGPAPGRAAVRGELLRDRVHGRAAHLDGAVAAGGGDRGALGGRAQSRGGHVHPRLRAGARARSGPVPGTGRTRARRRRRGRADADDRPLPNVRHGRLDRARRVLRPPRPHRPRHRPLG